MAVDSFDKRLAVASAGAGQLPIVGIPAALLIETWRAFRVPTAKKDVESNNIPSP